MIMASKRHRCVEKRDSLVPAAAPDLGWRPEQDVTGSTSHNVTASNSKNVKTTRQVKNLTLVYKLNVVMVVVKLPTGSERDLSSTETCPGGPPRSSPTSKFSFTDDQQLHINFCKSLSLHCDDEILAEIRETTDDFVFAVSPFWLNSGVKSSDSRSPFPSVHRFLDN
jgi:hypothetical protein